MLASDRLARVGTLLMQLLQMAYQQRAEVALISFAGVRATTHLYPTASTPPNSRTVKQWLQGIRAGGGTPFADGMARMNALLTQAFRRQPAQERWLWLIGDGRSRECPALPLYTDRRVIVDCEWQRIALGRCRDLAAAWDASYLSLEELEQK